MDVFVHILSSRDEYHYKDCFGKERIISSYRLEMTARIVGNVRKHWENA